MNALIIGLGSIGLGSKNLKIFKSHTNFFYKSKKFNLLAVVDKDFKKIALFKKRFKRKGIIAETNLKFLKANQIKKIDVICISAPDEKNITIIKQVLKLRSIPKIFVLEKPVATKVQTFKKIISIIKYKKVIINYQRIFDKNYMRKFNELVNQKDMNIKIVFNNGLFENFSHLLSLLIFYFKKPIKIEKPLNGEKNILSLYFKNNIKVHCHKIKKESYNILDMIIYAKKNKINFFSGGHNIITEKIYNYDFLNNYKLSKIQENIKIKQIFSLDFFLSNKYTKKLQKKLIDCSEETIKVINKIN